MSSVVKLSWISEIWHGKSFGRLALNEVLSVHMAGAQGRWLDLGAGRTPSYARFLPSTMERMSTDVQPHEGGVVVDANQPLPFSDHEFDGVMALNMLYITEDPVSVLQELRRVVKPNGELVATFPFFFLEHPEPHDYHRWTSEGVRRALQSAGWSEVTVRPMGGMGTVFGMSLLPFRGHWIVRLLCAPFIWLWDRLVPWNMCTWAWFATGKKSKA